MKGAGWGVLGLMALVTLTRSDRPALLKDSDTAVLLRALDAHPGVWRWFVGDWPLENHFYRPIPTLLFKLDKALWGANAAGFGLTNASLVALMVAGTYHMARWITGKPSLGLLSAAMFTLWVTDFGFRLAGGLGWIPWAIPLITLGLAAWQRRGLTVSGLLVPSLVASFLLFELEGREALYAMTIGWLPGRTATSMGVFCLFAMGLYALYERRSAARDPEPPATPFDLPATRTSENAAPPRPAPWAILGSLVCIAGAFACYEQAVMLPACLLGVAVAMRVQGFRVRWGWQLAFWGLLLGYLALRRAVVPSAPSGYQLQQFRSSLEVLFSVGDYLLPPLRGLPGVGVWVSLGPLTLFALEPWLYLWEWARTLTTLSLLRRDWLPPVCGLLLSTLAFLPMAWMKPFAHYHVWPMALRTLLVVGLLPVLGRVLVSAWSPPPTPAPPRPDL